MCVYVTVWNNRIFYLEDNLTEGRVYNRSITVIKIRIIQCSFMKA